MFTEEFRNPLLSQGLLEKIKNFPLTQPVKFMEVCGTHTQAIFRSGIRSLLPSKIQLVSGPGCPVCVTAQEDLDYAIALAGENDVILTTFGDMLRVPGSFTTLEEEKSKGAYVKIVYSPEESLKLARENPNKKVVFLGIGFETTAPTVAATIIEAESLGLNNFFVFARHKLIPPALKFLAHHPELHLDGFLCPGHVSVIIGVAAYREVAETAKIPMVISGFEPLDILASLLMLLRQVETGTYKVENQYSRLVREKGNIKAQEILQQVFIVRDANWRGLGIIKQSGLEINEEYQRFNAESVFAVEKKSTLEPSDCRCGEVLLGKITPLNCPLFAQSCTPLNPIGACMVSTEGTCATYYKYEREKKL